MEYEGDADTDSDTDTDSDSDVDVEAEYIVGEYDVKILSATESDTLVDWLQVNGYHVPDASADLLGEYIDAGSYFLAAQVREDAQIESGQKLSPLQFSYTAEVYSLPIRIGTLNSPGVQDLRIYAVNTESEGAVGISNYPQATPENDCMWCGDDFSAFYGGVLDAALVGGQASWIEEYAWSGGWCDPCAGTPPSESDLASLGWTGDAYSSHLTRLRMRYTPEQATQDLTLYLSRDNQARQLKYVVYNPQLEDRFPMCFSGWVEEPLTCDDTLSETEVATAVAECVAEQSGTPTGCGCAGAGAGPSTALAMLAAALAARSRARR